MGSSFLALFLVVAGWVMNPGNSRKLLLPLAGVAVGLIAAELFFIGHVVLRFDVARSAFESYSRTRSLATARVLPDQAVVRLLLN